MTETIIDFEKDIEVDVEDGIKPTPEVTFYPQPETRPDPLVTISENIPQELKDILRWRVWKYTWNSKKGKWTKPPFNIQGSQVGATEKPYYSFDTVIKVVSTKGFDGIGFILVKDDNIVYTGADIDDCITYITLDDGTVIREFSDIAKRILAVCDGRTYAEISPSGTGIRIIFKGTIPTSIKLDPLGIEIYCHSRYLTMTGHHVEGTALTICNSQNLIDEVYKEYKALRKTYLDDHSNKYNGIDPSTLPDIDFDPNGTLVPHLDQLNLSDYILDLITNGYEGDDRSGMDYYIVGYLCENTCLENEHIRGIYYKYPIGVNGKYGERNQQSADKYLGNIIKKHRAIIAQCKKEEYELYERTKEFTLKMSAENKNRQQPKGVQQTAEPSSDNNQNADATIVGDSENPIDASQLFGGRLFTFEATQGGIVKAWIKHLGNDWLYITGYALWFKWTGTHWIPTDRFAMEFKDTIFNMLDDVYRDSTSLVAEYSKALAKAEDEGNKKEVKRFKGLVAEAKQYVSLSDFTNTKLNSIESMIRNKNFTIAENINQGYYLNLANGVLDLNTFELTPHKREYYFTYCIPVDYNPEATAPRFEQFLREVLVYDPNREDLESVVSPEIYDRILNGEWIPDPEEIALVEEYLGYSLTPDTEKQVFVLLTGEGSNGKSTLLETIQKLLGNLQYTVAFQKIGKPGNYSLPEINGKRALLSTESKKGESINEDLIKQIVDGDTIPDVRPIYGSEINLKSQAKIWWAMNHKPVITDTSNSIWRRMKVIHFPRVFEKLSKHQKPNVDLSTLSIRDDHLKSKLATELSGILNIAIRGLQRLRQQDNFTESLAVNQAVSGYKKQSNVVHLWLEAGGEKGDWGILETLSTSGDDVYENYVKWCEKNGRRPQNQTNFGEDVKKLPCVKHKRTNRGVYYNIGINFSQ